MNWGTLEDLNLAALKEMLTEILKHATPRDKDFIKDLALEIGKREKVTINHLREGE